MNLQKVILELGDMGCHSFTTRGNRTTFCTPKGKDRGVQLVRRTGHLVLMEINPATNDLNEAVIWASIDDLLASVL